MALHKFSEAMQAHIDAGHFNIYPKKWMNNKRLWVWTKGNTQTIGGVCAYQMEAEEAAVAWYNEQLSKS